MFFVAVEFDFLVDLLNNFRYNSMQRGEKYMEFENLKKLFADENFLAEIANIESVQELQSKLKDIGLDITPEFAEKFIKTKNDIEERKLADEELESVAGGVRFSSPRAKACVLALGMLLPMAGNATQVEAGFSFPHIFKRGVLTQGERDKAIPHNDVSIDTLKIPGVPSVSSLINKMKQNGGADAQYADMIPKSFTVYDLNETYVNSLSQKNN